MVDGTLGVRPRTMNTMSFALDTGAGFNIDRGEALLTGWENEVYIESALSRLSDSNSNPL